MKDPKDSKSIVTTANPSRVFVRVADNTPLQQLLDFALFIRILILIMMAISCYTFPEQLRTITQDDSLVTFPLRLMEDLPQPFSLPNTFCSSNFIQRLLGEKSYDDNHFVLKNSNHSPVWSFLLTPLTRWDAARFLRIANEPNIRYPQHQYMYHLINHESIPTTNATSDIMVKTCPNVDHIVQESEEAHPFLPLFPFLIQGMATLLLFFVPARLLPPTCESILVLSSYLLNTFCFLWSAKQLFLMTKLILDTSTFARTCDNQRNIMGTPSNKNQSTDTTISSSLSSEQWARRVLLLYMINPASVFFNTTYSESLGAALIFTGHHWMLQYQLASKKSVTLIIITWFIWLSGCYVRSNGVVNAGFLFLYGIGGMLTYRTQTTVRTFMFFSIVVGSIFLIGGSIGWYNYKAYRNHCVIEPSIFDEAASIEAASLADCQLQYQYQMPDWCKEGPYFNIYSHVQAKYWNVGFLRYYELKQIPNFLLAAPVLCLSLCAAVNWIRISWNRYPIASERRFFQRPHRLLEWAVLALQHFVNADMSFSESSVLQGSEPKTSEMALLGHPILLGHYAVLAASAILGLTMAHVQISTRMIFSTCPAIYWYLVVKICKHCPLGDAILYWSLLYILLGIIMHPNWLPWT